MPSLAVAAAVMGVFGTRRAASEGSSLAALAAMPRSGDAHALAPSTSTARHSLRTSFKCAASRHASSLAPQLALHPVALWTVMKAPSLKTAVMVDDAAGKLGKGNGTQCSCRSGGRILMSTSCGLSSTSLMPWLTGPRALSRVRFSVAFHAALLGYKHNLLTLQSRADDHMWHSKA
jgi:hypothetical protein